MRLFLLSIAPFTFLVYLLGEFGDELVRKIFEFLMKTI